MKKSEPLWLNDYEKALSEARKQQKAILMVFSGSDWCKACMQLREQVFEKQSFKDFANKKLILLNLDFPRNKKNRLSKEQNLHSEKIAEKYNPEGIFPRVLLLNDRGEVLAQIKQNNLESEKFILEIRKLLEP